MKILVLFDIKYKDFGKDAKISLTRAIFCAIQPNFK